MANEVRYEITGSAPGSILVRYTMGTEWIDLPLPWHGEGDINEFIGRYTPRQQLLAKQVAPTAFAALVGTSGIAEDPKPPAPEPAPEPPAS